VAWIWLDIEVMRAVHEDQLLAHGGISGVRDEGMFLSALARPENLANYGEPDFADLAASYGFGIAKNHPFLDGNKRTAFVSVELFLLLNGCKLTAKDSDCILTILAIAGGDMNETDFASWIRRNTKLIS
jgi:death-on-curing protein